MRYISVCSGIEAASIAWGYLGWSPAYFSEIEPHPCAVLASRWPKVPNLGDLSKIEIQPNGDIKYGDEALGTAHVIPNDGRKIDLIVGGSPCQDASCAGKREGLVKGKKSSLAFSYARLAYELAAYRGLRWVLWENVPGCFNLNNGEDFAAFLSSIAGWQVKPPKGGWGSFGIVPPATKGNFGLCWRVLDVQYARVDGFPEAIPQRRRRIFLVAHLGSWERAAEILFEQRGLLGNQPPKRKKKQAVARTSGASPCGNDGVHASHGGVAEQEAESGAGENQGDDACGRRNADGAGDADCTGVGAFMGGQGAKAGSIAFSEECSPTVKASPSGGNTIPTVMCVHGSQDPIHNDGECANALGRNQGAETCIAEEPFTGDVSSVIDASYYKGNGTRNGNERPLVLESEKDAFNFEMFSGECKGVSPALQAQRAKDTLVYDAETPEDQTGG